MMSSGTTEGLLCSNGDAATNAAMCESCNFVTSVTRNAGGQNFVDKAQEYRIHSRYRSRLA